MSYAEFDGVVGFTVRARIGIPAARFTLRFHKENVCYLTKSQCSHRENHQTVYARTLSRSAHIL